ncbi:hypothetical protein Taqua_02412 [Tepidimonas aquatica]|uniref:Uncharacterized protein n=1 Tax=Tepidimonas aquatica TaxID=247482 RepID=A0A554W9Y7_9BURK|nr:hypothetical protein Taqua_02412 [Tepidimonas aquatica]
MIWLSVKRDFFMVEILLRDSLLLSALVLRGDYPSNHSGMKAVSIATAVPPCMAT